MFTVLLGKPNRFVSAKSVTRFDFNLGPIEYSFDCVSLIFVFFIFWDIQSDYHQHLTRWLIYVSCAVNFVAFKCWENCRTYINSLLNSTPAFAHFEPARWNLLFFFNISVPFPFQNEENWKCLLASTNVSALCLDFDEVSAILQALHIRALLSRSSGEMKFDSSSCMLKPVYFAFVKTMLQIFFANYTFC